MDTKNKEILFKPCMTECLLMVMVPLMLILALIIQIPKKIL